mmetsp:Transcript_36583/g.96401  ORF Transcript_36583/g.96401 Transcript_36583/m.96401 type:complete len:213 (-) Transcript_36583:186-824(-)
MDCVVVPGSKSVALATTGFWPSTSQETVLPSKCGSTVMRISPAKSSSSCLPLPVAQFTTRDSVPPAKGTMFMPALNRSAKEAFGRSISRASVSPGRIGIVRLRFRSALAPWKMSMRLVSESGSNLRGCVGCKSALRGTMKHETFTLPFRGPRPGATSTRQRRRCTTVAPRLRVAAVSVCTCSKFREPWKLRLIGPSSRSSGRISTMTQRTIS